MLWISSVLESTQAQKSGKGVNYLVFGLGADTPAWIDINCLGRTVFLENSAEWTRLVTQEIAKKHNSTLEAYTVKYKGKMAEPQAFFDNPWLMEVPEAVSDTCWEVILVDAPHGFAPRQGHPGRMESTYFALQHARRCIDKGALSHVHIFLHDMNRPLEQKIAGRYLTPRYGAQHLGTLKGPLGWLAGYSVGKM